MADLSVRSDRRDGRAVLEVSGDLDLATVTVLRDAATDELRSEGISELVLDLTGVTFLDSSGLGALLQVRAETMAAGRALTVNGVAPGAARIIAIAGLSSTFGVPEP